MVGAGGMAAGYVTTGTTRGALYGAFSAELFFGVGEAFDGAGWAQAGEGQGVLGSNLNSVGYTSAILAHGVAGGIVSSLEGGKFGSGFLGAGVSEAFSGVTAGIDTRAMGVSAERTIVAAMIGGTASAVSGGKFGDGAISAAFGQIYGDAAQGAAMDRRMAAASRFDPDYAVAFEWPMPPQWLVNGATGFGDGVYSGITFGLGNLQDVRDFIGVTGDVDPSSKAYRYAHIAGVFEGGAALGGSLAAKSFVPGGWTNSNRYLRVGYGRNGGDRVFRAAGQWVKSVTGDAHFDFWTAGKW